MRIIKNNTLEFPSLLNTLTGDRNYFASRKTNSGENIIQMKNRYEELFESLYIYGKKIKEIDSISVINEHLKASLSKFMKINEVGFFNSAKADSAPAPLTTDIKENTLIFINKIYEEGMLQKILKHGNISIFTSRSKYSENYSYYLIYPVIDIDRVNQYFLLINTLEKHFEAGTFLRKVLESFIQLFVPRVECLIQKKELSQTYDELQVYQSKIVNDYKLSAVGEMTYLLIDQIISPMQVVLSCVNMIENQDTSDNQIFNTIKAQIKKVQLITDNIVKFSNADQATTSILPCALNSFINKYHEFLKSYLYKRNYEVFLDLEDDLPPILSTPNFMNQILTNIFSLMVNTADTGGIYLQTKYYDTHVRLRVLSTDYTIIQSDKKRNFSNNINLMMLETLMRKHDGSVNFNSTAIEGSSLELIFPLKRTLLK